MKTPKPPARKPLFQPYPKYLQITDLLRKRILTQMKPGERIPAEVALSQDFGVSRETLRQALEPLEREGLITRTRGRGSFVSERPRRSAPEKLTGMTEDMVSLGMNTRARVLGHSFMEAEGKVGAYLNLEPGSPIVRIERLREFDGAPMSHHMAYLPLDVGARALREDLENNSIILVLGRKLRHPLEEDRQVVEADGADVQLAAHLEVPIGAPLLLVRRLYITANERPVAYFESHFRADRYMYTVKLRQGPASTPATRRSKA